MMLSSSGKWAAHPDPAKRMAAYADPGADQVQTVLAGGEAVEVKGVVADGVPMARIVRPVPMPALNTTWALVMDVPLAAMCVCCAMEQFFHPQMIAEAVAKPFGPKIDQMIDFILASLAPRGARN